MEEEKKKKEEFDELIGKLTDPCDRKTETGATERKKASEARYVRLSPQQFADTKEGYLQEGEVMEITFGEEILESEHPLNSITQDEPQAEETEQITEVVEGEACENMMQVKEQQHNERVQVVQDEESGKGKAG